MKKIIFAFIAVTIIAMGGIINAANYEMKKISSPEMLQSSSVTVMWIRNNGSVWMKTKKTGQYDSDSNTITIGGSTYKVGENPYYGEEDSHGRGAYRYVAGGQYYFNL